MPEMSGLEVCHKLKDNPATQDIPIIFLTAVTDAEHEREAFEAGCVDFITKPITPLTTLARVRTHLQLSENNKHNKHLIAIKTKELDDSLKSAIGMLGWEGEFK